MSAGNVDVVREFFARRERGDYAVEFIDPKIEYHQRGGGPPDFVGVSVRGIADLRIVTADYLRVWENLEYKLLSVAGHADDVVVLERHSGHGRQTGAHASHDMVHVISVLDRRIVRWVAYWEPAAAEQALGIEL
jgi:ketosteroid isomerase-like protein